MNLAAEITMIVGSTVAVIALVLDTILRAKWNRWYFGWGFTIYRKYYDINTVAPFNMKDFTEQTDVPSFPKFIFRRQPDGRIFFREALINFKYISFFYRYSVMHGVIIEEGNKYVVNGKIDLQLFAILLVSVLFISWPFIAVQAIVICWPIIVFVLTGASAILLLTINYKLQVERYNKIGELISHGKATL